MASHGITKTYEFLIKKFPYICDQPRFVKVPLISPYSFHSPKHFDFKRISPLGIPTDVHAIHRSTCTFVQKIAVCKQNFFFIFIFLFIKLSSLLIP